MSLASVDNILFITVLVTHILIYKQFQILLDLFLFYLLFFKQYLFSLIVPFIYFVL